MAALHLNVSFTNIVFLVRRSEPSFLTYIFTALFCVAAICDTLSHELFIVSFEIKQRMIIYTRLCPRLSSSSASPPRRLQDGK